MEGGRPTSERRCSEPQPESSSRAARATRGFIDGQIAVGRAGGAGDDAGLAGSGDDGFDGRVGVFVEDADVFAEAAGFCGDAAGAERDTGAFEGQTHVVAFLDEDGTAEVGQGDGLVGGDRLLGGEADCVR